MQVGYSRAREYVPWLVASSSAPLLARLGLECFSDIGFNRKHFLCGNLLFLRGYAGYAGYRV